MALKKRSAARFTIDAKAVDLPVALRDCASGCPTPVPRNAAIATVRAVSVAKPRLRTFAVTSLQSDGQAIAVTGNF